MDGDTDTTPVQEDFRQVVQEHIKYIKDSTSPQVGNDSTNISNIETVDQINNIGKKFGNGVAIGMANGVNQMANGTAHIVNGYGIKAPPLARTITVERNGEMNFMDGHI